MFVVLATTRGRETQVHVRAELVAAVAQTIADRDLSQAQAARIRRADHPTLSKALRGRAGRVSLDKLPEWLMVLGRPVDLRIGHGPNSLAILTLVLDGRHPAG